MKSKASSTTEWPGAFTALGQAFEAIQRNATPLLYYLGALLIGQLLVVVMTGHLPTGSAFRAHNHSQNVSALLLALVSLIFLPYMIRYQLALAKGKVVTASALLQPDFKLYVNIILSLLLGGLLVIGGALPLLIPLIWVIPWVSLLIFAVVDLDVGPSAALKEVIRLSSHNKSKIWALFGVSILLAIAGSFFSRLPLAGVLVSSALGAVSQTALAILYVWLRKYTPDADSAEA